MTCPRDGGIPCDVDVEGGAEGGIGHIHRIDGGAVGEDNILASSPGRRILDRTRGEEGRTTEEDAAQIVAHTRLDEGTEEDANEEGTPTDCSTSYH